MTQKVETDAIVPSPLEYTIATGKETLRILKSAATLIPVPFLQDAIQVALTVLELCEVCPYYCARFKC